MKIGILGTGIVGRTLGSALSEAGHDVVYGTRDVDDTLARTEGDAMGNPPFGAWMEGRPEAELGPFEEAAAHGDIVVNATAGVASLEALEQAGEENLRDKILLDVANPLDFSDGFPPTLAFCNTDSLGERIQARFPDTKVVKTLNTMNCRMMVAPGLVPGEHVVFMSGDDDNAKARVRRRLSEWFGWDPDHVVDLGDISTSRGTEMLFPLWARLYRTVGHPHFNFHVRVGPTPAM